MPSNKRNETRGGWNKITDLERYLNETAEKHNNVDYGRFVWLVESGVNIANICRAMGRDKEHPLARDVAERYVKIYKKKRKAGGPKGTARNSRAQP